jgi:hypothetical protein
MEVKVGSIVVYSLPLEGEKSGVIFTSIGNVLKLSTTHATLSVASETKFPYTPKKLPAVHRADTYDLKEEKVTSFKVPLLFVRKAVDPRQKVDVNLLAGAVSLNGNQTFTMWSNADHDYVFRGLIFDFRGLRTYMEPKVIATVDHRIKERITFEEGDVTAEPLDPKDPALSFILKQCPTSVLLSRRNPNYSVPLACERWTPKETKDFIRDEIRRDLAQLGAETLTQIKAVLRGGEGYYAFTENDVYIDTRAFLGTVYFNPLEEKFDIVSFDETRQKEDDNAQFGRNVVFRPGHAMFLGPEIAVSEVKTMTGFYNMSLAVNNLLLLMEHGLKHPLFQGDKDRALGLMVTSDYPYPHVQDLARFYLDPLSSNKVCKKWRRKYLWWLSK